ncbi:hypothetical protein [Methylobacterium tardum]|uniref:hypothetical protein n=1 Tax=Methylobacterium tardum TaxID=374432 RepID=UPI00360E1EC1
MSLRARPDGPGHPVPMRAWPEDEALWLDENGVRRPQAARHVLASLQPSTAGVGTRPARRARPGS